MKCRRILFEGERYADGVFSDGIQHTDCLAHVIKLVWI